METTTPTNELVLECYGSPRLCESLADPAIPLPQGLSVLLQQVAAGVTDPGTLYDDADRGDLFRATLLYVKRVVMIPGGDCYRRLAVTSAASQTLVDNHYRWLLAILQADTDSSAKELHQNVALLDEAYGILGDPEKRLLYDKALDEAEPAADSGAMGRLSPGAGWALIPAHPVASDRASVALSWDSYRLAGLPRLSNGALLATSVAAVLVIAVMAPVVNQYLKPWLAGDWPVFDGASHMSVVSAAPVRVPAEAVSESAGADVLYAPIGFLPRAHGGAAVPWTAHSEARATPSGGVRETGPGSSGVALAAAGPAPRSARTADAGKPVQHTVAASPRAAAVPSPRTAPPVSVHAPQSTEGSTPEQLAAEGGDAPATSPPPLGISTIGESDLTHLMTEFVSAYIAGNLGDLMALFDENARTNDRSDRRGIAQDYRELFRSTDARQFELSDLNWTTGFRNAQAEGRFSVRIKPKWQTRETVVQGTIRLHVQKRADHMVITDLYHEYEGS